LDKNLVITSDSDTDLSSSLCREACKEKEKNGGDCDVNMSQYMTAGESHLEAQELEYLLFYLPNLQIFDITRSYKRYWYLTCLCGLDPTKYLERIERIPRSESKYDDGDSMDKRLHSEACYNFRHTLTHLALDHSATSKYTFNNRMDFDLSLLPDFKSLADLDLSHKCDSNITLLDIQDACPNLQSIYNYISG
jgi:hypothetical protein